MIVAVAAMFIIISGFSGLEDSTKILFLTFMLILPKKVPKEKLSLIFKSNFYPEI